MSQIAQQVNTDADGDFPRVEDAIFEFDDIVRKKVDPEKETTKQTRQHDPATQPNGNEPASN